jgi:peptidyl-prolyl cis-trans isomerase SurA
MNRLRNLFLILVFCLQFVAVSQRANSAVLLDRVVAMVNNDIITWSELRKTIQLENKELLNALSDTEKEQRIQKFERPFLNSMIDMQLQLQDAARIGLIVNPAETENAINDIKKKFNLTEEGLIQHLNADNLTLEEYRARLGEQILISKVVRFRVVDSILITDEEIQKYLETHREDFREDEKIKIRQILFTEGNRIQKTQEVLKRIQNGEDFAQLASELSEDPSRTFGGDLGYVSRGSVMKEIETVAFSLKVGQVSEPFPSSKGIHIIKIEDRLEGGVTEQAQEKIKNILYEKAYIAKYEDWLKKLREGAYIEINL